MFYLGCDLITPINIDLRERVHTRSCGASNKVEPALLEHQLLLYSKCELPISRCYSVVTILAITPEESHRIEANHVVLRSWKSVSNSDIGG